MLVTLDVTAMQNEFVGKSFHRLRVRAVRPFGLKALRLECQCVCGAVVLAKPYELRHREKTSCGCWKKEVLGNATRKHGRANSSVTGYANRTYGIWQAMRDRCTNPNRSDFYRYGGRGIEVCARWSDFALFLADMGEAPKGLTLDRIDNDKGYYLENCRWATRSQQSYNSTTIVWVTHKGQRRSLSDWCRINGLSKGTYYSRRKRGWSVKRSLGLVKN